MAISFRVNLTHPLLKLVLLFPTGALLAQNVVTNPTASLNVKIVKGKVTLSAGAATVTSLPFGNTSFICVANDQTTATNGAHMIEASSTTAAVTGTGTDTIAYLCMGN